MRTVAEFRIQHRQLLDARGETTEALPAFAQDPQRVLAMYRLMTLVRVFDTTDAMFDNLFATLPAHLHEQRATARKYST